MTSASLKMKWIERAAVIILFAVVTPLWLYSQEKSVTPAVTTAESTTGDATAAKAALAATAEKYRSLRTYRDEFHFTAKLTTKDGAEPEIGELDGKLLFAAPNRLVSKSDTVDLYYDGETLRRISPMMRQYTQSTGKAALRQLRPDAPVSDDPTSFGVHPLAALLADRDLTPEEALAIAEFEGIVPDTLAGRPGQRIRGKLRLPQLPGGGLTSFTAFISDETRLIEEVRADVTEAARAFTQGEHADSGIGEITSAEVMLRFTDVTVDSEIPEDQLAFDAAGASKVEAFAYRSSRPVSPLNLLGLPAPSLAGPMLDGGTFDLAAQKDKTIVVAFWGTWASNAAGLLADLKQITADNSNASVVVVGVNRNGAVSETAVRALLTKCDTSIPQVLDRDGTIVERWEISALPTVVLINDKGEVADVFPIWTGASRDALAERIAKLLKAEPLYTSNELATRRAQANDDDQANGMSLRIPADQTGTMTLEAGDSQMVRGSRWNMTQQDLDGDGEIELILPDWNGGISIVKPSTGDVRRVSLRNYREIGIQTVNGILIDGQYCWLCAGSKYISTSGSRGRQNAVLRLYAPEGEILWTFRPDIGEDASSQSCAAAGDFDGDGNVEYALGLTTFEQRYMGENSWSMENMKSRLIILDRQGQVLAQKELSNQIELLYAPPALPGKSTSLLCISMGQLERYTLSPRKTIE